LTATLVAPPSWRRLAFVADLHLGDAAPRTTTAFVDWLGAAARDADALFVLGDLFESWVGDDQLEVDTSARRVVGALRAYVDGGGALALQCGNRDFLLGDALAGACGAQRLGDPCVLQFGGRRIVLTHGDALCVADQPYQRWRAQCRAAAWQAAFTAQPLAARLAQAAAARQASRSAQAAQENWADADPLEAARWLRDANARWMIHGHTHRPRSHWRDGTLRDVLSDWDLDHAARAEVLWLERGPGSTIDVRRAPPIAAT
jgi:UDP-2,3-diacylglucosamine hydrolase